MMHSTPVPYPAAILKSGKDRFYESFYSRPLPCSHFGIPGRIGFMNHSTPVPCPAAILEFWEGWVLQYDACCTRVPVPCLADILKIRDG
jgi:hypothetical protein